MFEGEAMVMHDIETMSTASNACICSIGAVVFDVGKGITDEFYITIDAKDCKALGLDISPETVAWWSKQNPAALKMLMKDNVKLRPALTQYSKWFNRRSMKVWGNGSAFDNVILRNAYRAAGMGEPWKYHQEMCFRTLATLFPEVPKPKRTGTYHNALDDAKFQALHFIAMLGE